MAWQLSRNRWRCKVCNTILESKHRHDFVTCQCGNFVDGGLDYTRLSATRNELENLCEHQEVKDD